MLLPDYVATRGPESGCPCNGPQPGKNTVKGKLSAQPPVRIRRNYFTVATSDRTNPQVTNISGLQISNFGKIVLKCKK